MRGGGCWGGVRVAGARVPFIGSRGGAEVAGL
jgi:hypothetical protein